MVQPANTRPDVVALLLDLDMLDLQSTPEHWTHSDCRPVTAEERRLVSSATTAELMAACDYLLSVGSVEREKTEAVERLVELTDRADQGKTLSADEWAEVQRTSEAVALQAPPGDPIKLGEPDRELAEPPAPDTDPAATQRREFAQAAAWYERTDDPEVLNVWRAKAAE